MNEYAKEKAKNDKIRQNIFWQSEKLASVITICVCFFVSIVFVCGLLISSFTFSIFPPYISWSIISLYIILASGDFLFGVTIRKLYK